MTRHIAWALILRGAIAILLGLTAIRKPGIAAVAFVFVFGAYALADGVLDFFLAGRIRKAGLGFGWYALSGVASLIVGALAFASPAITLLALVILVGVRAIIVGGFEIVAAFSWQDVDPRWLLGITGGLSAVFGIMLLASPMAGGIALIWTIGVYGVVLGVALIALGFRLFSGIKHRDVGHSPAVAPA